MGNGKTRTIFCPWPVVNFWARRWICLSFRFSRWGRSGNLRWHRAIEAMENLLNMALMSLSQHDLKLQYAINCDMLTQRESSIFLTFSCLAICIAAWSTTGSDYPNLAGLLRILFDSQIQLKENHVSLGSFQWKIMVSSFSSWNPEVILYIYIFPAINLHLFHGFSSLLC